MRRLSTTIFCRTIAAPFTFHRTVRAYTSLLTTMIPQPTDLCVSFLTVGTLEGFDSHVESFVVGQSVFMREGFFTFITFVWFLSCVCANVHLCGRLMIQGSVIFYMLYCREAKIKCNSRKKAFQNNQDFLSSII